MAENIRTFKYTCINIRSGNYLKKKKKKKKFIITILEELRDGGMKERDSEQDKEWLQSLCE